MTATIWHAISAPWSEPILRRAFAEVALLGIAGGALGCWVLFYNLAYSAESLAHGLLPGLVLASLAGLPLLLGGAAGILVAAVAVAAAGRIPAIGRDTAVGVVVTTLFGLGVLLALSPQTPAGLQGLLFGDPLGISDIDLVLAAGLVAVVLTALGLAHGRLLVVGFDRTAARGLGVAPGRVDLALLCLLALALLVAVQGLGNLLVVAMVVAPAAAARHLTRRMPEMLMASAGLAMLAGWAGIYLSYYARTAAGASIAGMLVLTVALASATGMRRRRVEVEASTS
ncbi:MAG: hypothetical protein QOG68_309 [Solirubrobacteraceae bacterium]|nr:hypothetical protein [Solirubrobacteraceae bacterium]